jgi:hypothetical protein
MTDKPMPPDPAIIERLEAAEAQHAVTGVAPLAYDTQKNRVHLKNVIHGVTQALERELDEHGRRALRDRLEEAAADAQRVQRPACWCVLAESAPERVEALLLPTAFPERLVEDTRYYVRPLIQAAVSHGEFLLLALSQGDVRLYRMRGERLEPLSVDDLPGSLTEVVGHQVERPALKHHVQHHPAAGAQFHTQGKGRDDRDPELERFVEAVDEAITADSRLRGHHLMVAAVEELDAAYRHVSQHPLLLDVSVRLSPDQTSEDDLRRAALDAFGQWRQADCGRFLQDLEERPDHRASDPAEIVRASLEGRVDTLISDRAQPLWGRFDPESWQVTLHEQRAADSRDLVDVAMRATWRQGGRIRVLEGDPPAGMAGLMMARLRF